MSGIVGSKFNHRGSGLVASLGTDGQHMLSSGAGKKHVFETVAAGGGDLELLQTISFTSDTATATFDGDFTSDFTNYKVYLTTSNKTGVASLFCRTRRSDAQVTASSYRGIFPGDKNDTADTHAFYNSGLYGENYWKLSQNCENITDTVGDITIWNPLGTAHFKYIMATTSANNESSYNHWFIYDSLHMDYSAKTAISGIDFYFESQDMQRGLFHLYGLKNS